MRLLLLFLLLSCFCSAQLADVPLAFEQIQEKPTLLSYRAQSNKLPKGGHIQGMQLYTADSLRYVVISGSSSQHSYYLISGEGWETQWGYSYSPEVRKLFDSPYRHAGGCQLSGCYLAVGVEDNYKRDKAQIAVVDLRNGSVKTALQRHGEYERSTAGAVGFTATGDGQYWLAVGDWDSRHIDFYKSPTADFQFDSLATYVAPVQNWPAFQSINLVSDTAGNLFLVGFSLNRGKNRADLFSVNLHKGMQLHLISTRYFKCSRGAGFRYGAGVAIIDNKLSIISSARRLKGRNYGNVFMGNN